MALSMTEPTVHSVPTHAAPHAVRVSAAFMRRHPLHWVALGFGTGLSPVAPGTVGTLLGWLLFFVAHLYFAAFMARPEFILPILAVCFAFGIWACSVTGRHLGVADHGALVWDEMVAIFIVLTFVPPEFVWQLGAVVLFRFFDIYKPAPIRALEQRVPGGLGVMIDDLMAAFYTLLVIAVVKTVSGL